MATNFEVLERAEKVELLTAELYAAFARHFCADPSALQLFTRLRDEEQQHASRVRMLAVQARQDRKLLAKIAVDTSRIDAIVREIGGIIAAVEAGEWRLGLPETRKELMELEERCASAHSDGLQGVHASLRAFFEQLASQDRAHQELLRG
ncbi:MAG TPA: hypothetical protein VF841_18100 [Anaeromyxobacter sp.]